MGLPALIAAGVALTFMAACSHQGTAHPMEPRGVRLGESFTLRVGETATVDDAKVTVTFQKVVRDSRCPKDVTCIRAGEAVVVLALETEAGRSAVLELEVPPGGGSHAQTFEAFQVTVLELHPQTESTKSIDPSAYVATVRVSQT